MYMPLFELPLPSTSCVEKRVRRTEKNYYCGDAVVTTTTAPSAVVVFLPLRTSAVAAVEGVDVQ